MCIGRAARCCIRQAPRAEETRRDAIVTHRPAGCRRGQREMEEQSMISGVLRKHWLGRVAGGLAVTGLLLGATMTSVHARPSAATPDFGGSYAVRFSDPPDCLDPHKTA